MTRVRDNRVQDTPERENEEIVRRGFGALAAGRLDDALAVIDPNLEWVFLDPTQADPEPQVCNGRDELAVRIRSGAGRWFRLELEEAVGHGDLVLVVTRSAGADDARAATSGDRNFHVVTLRGGRITRLRACRGRDEATALAAAPEW